MNLKDQGYRFVYVDGAYRWVHPLEVPANAVDCTDMGDDEFAQFVASA